MIRRVTSVSASRLGSRSSTSAARPDQYNSFGSPKHSTVAESRPVSPHVRIYKLPLPAVSSIVNRVTGVGIAVGAVALAFPAILHPESVPALILSVKAISPILVTFAKLCISYPLTYHTLAGIRHLYWDYSSRGINQIRDVDLSSRYIFWGSILIAILLATLEF